MKNHGRHMLIWGFLRCLLGAWLRRKFNFTPEPVGVKGPYLVLANHTTNWDPLLVALSFREQMYFVASEHIFRWGLFTLAIRWLVDPIARLKATTASDTAKAIMRRLNGGANVCLFAEGDRSWDGLLSGILPSTGKLARYSGATLVTYRLEGGYFTSPRWAGAKLRRGKMKGYAVGVYSPDTLRRMTAEEVNAAIRDDLAENAWERQCKDPVAYQGKNLAQHLERMLCVCPKCSRLGTLASSGGVLSCSCGFSVKYNEFGYFEGGDLPFENLLLWDRWQTEKLYERAGAAGEEMIFGDDRMELREIFGHGKAGGAITGAIRLFRDRLEVCGMVFPLCDISGLAIHGAQSMDITAGKRHFELRSRAVRCMRKYLTVFQYLTNKLREGVNA